jgi:general nucleoside transport system permease protein
LDIGLFLAASVTAATPLLFATLGEIITEKSGHLNLGVEGLMLLGAVAGFQAAYLSGNPLIGLMGAVIAGIFGALIYSFLTVTLRANQVVSGLSLTIFGAGVTSFFGQYLMGKGIPQSVKSFFSPYHFPLLGDIPFLGPILFRQDAFVYLGYIMAIALGLYLYKSRSGLNLRTVGENPAAADAAGINVTLYKYVHILLGGALCALGGAYLSIVYITSWQENVTAGRGWIAVALVIFTTWNPYKALLGAFVFGALSIIGFRLQSTSITISQYIIDMLPYVATVVALVFMSMKKSKENAPPKSLGEPYFREDR